MTPGDEDAVAGARHPLVAALRATLWSAPARPRGGRPGLPRGPARPRSGRVLLGVGAGVAAALGWPVWPVRVALAVMLTPAGYALLWLLMPDADRDGGRGDDRARAVAAGLLVIGTGTLVALLGGRELLLAGLPVPVVVVLAAAVGAAVPALAWSALLAWRVLAASGLLTMAAVACWVGHPVLPGSPLPLAGLPVLAATLVLLALRHPRPVACGAGALTVPLLVAAAPLSVHPWPLTIALAAGAVGLLLIGGLARARRLLAGRLDRQRELREHDLARRAVLEERARIARDLHDVLAHHLSLIAVQAEAAPHRVDEVPEPLRAGLAAIRAAARDALDGTRAIVAVLRVDPDDGPADRGPAPGLHDLDELVRGVRRTGTEVAVSVRGVPVALPLDVDLAAYRIVQEALSNVTRHARGARASVTVTYRPTALVLEVVDSGGTGGPVAGGGHGLAGMRERATAHGGRLDAGPTADGGFAVLAELPVPAGPGR
ncbi:ATP-binding protein [Pseudonocardia humida]|uniref:histidine kinase n=1 Tax=Pseudonocardia humida TaxID=2800819 RepID=A0ABT0ZWB9_9PSEU|nr:ATP-binding protein [Pseudonocardia humida]MCO1654959.1 PspC domain-containing protein [Pseudonocardia humida]